MAEQRKQIVCMSTSNWHPFPTRKQNVMKRLKDADILYFEPTVTLLAPFKDKKTKERLSMYRSREGEVQGHVRILAAPPVLPFFNKFRFINRINQFFMARYVKKRMRQFGFTEPLLWCYSPTSCDLVGKVPHKGLVYDCVDRHSAYPGMINKRVVDRMEEELARRADVVFSTAAGLHETLAPYNPKSYMIPNGAAYEIFSRAQDKLEMPPELADIPHPIFGFIGMLQECIAYDAIEALADDYPQASIVFIGRPLPGVDTQRLARHANIKLLGIVPQEELPAYIAQFDVCLNTFVPGALSKDVSPLKFYEYLATGKPIVSMKEPLQVLDYSDVIYLCDSNESFIAQCRKAAQEDDPALTHKRMACGKACSWDERVRAMVNILREQQLM